MYGKHWQGEDNPLRAVVTGGAGFLGSHLCDYLLDRGWEVLAIDNLVTGTPSNLRHLAANPKFAIVQHDVTKFIDVPGPVDYVLHFASPASPVDYLKLPIQTLKVGSLNRIHILFSPNQPLNPADFGIVNGITGPIGLPQIIIGAVGTAGALDIGGPSGFPQGRGDATVVLSDTLHWLRGRHSLAIGGEMRRFYNNNVAQNIGSYTFATLQNFLNDQSNRFNVTIGSGNDKILEPAWGMFVQDNFKMTSNFTLELGLRYDYNSTPTDGNGLFSVFVPSTVSLVQVGTNGVGQAFHTNDKNIQPRLGFAWNPRHNDKTVVRAAYAILTDQPVSNAVSPLSSNPPFALPVTTTSATNSITFLNTGAATAGSIGPAIDQFHVR